MKKFVLFSLVFCLVFTTFVQIVFSADFAYDYFYGDNLFSDYECENASSFIYFPEKPATVDSAVYHSGTTSLSVQNAGASQWGEVCKFYSDFTTNKKYKVSMWIKSSSTQLTQLVPRMTYYYTDSSGATKYCSEYLRDTTIKNYSLSATYDWQKVDFDAVPLFTDYLSNSANTNLRNVAFCFVTGLSPATYTELSTVTVWFDQISIKEKTQDLYGNLTIDPECENISNAGSTAGNYMPVSLETTNVHSGNSCYKINGFRGSWRAYIANADIVANTTYDFSSWIRLDGPLENAQGNKILFQILYDYTYLNSSNEETKVADQKALSQFVSIEDTSTDWQAFKCQFIPDFSAATNANAISISNIRFAYVAYNLLGLNDTGINLWVDEVYVRKVPETGIRTVGLKSSVPASNDTAKSNTNVTFLFDSRDLDKYSILPSSVAVNNVTQTESTVTVSSSIDKENNLSSVVLDFNNNFASGSSQTVTLNGISDVWGRTISGITTTFTVEEDFIFSTLWYKYVGDAWVEFNVKDGLPASNVKAVTTITNNSESAQSLIGICGLYTSNSLNKISLSESKTIAYNSQDTITTILDCSNVTALSQVRFFVWNNLTDCYPLTLADGSSD